MMIKLFIDFLTGCMFDYMIKCSKIFDVFVFSDLVIGCIGDLVNVSFGVLKIERLGACAI